jgi:hypothetical protein
MTKRTPWIALAALALAGSILLPNLAHLASGEGNVNVPNAGSTGSIVQTSNSTSGCADEPGDIVDPCTSEPANNACGGAVQWPLDQTATSTGHVGGQTDPADWSTAWLVRTETLGATATATDAAMDSSTPLPIQYAAPNGDCSPYDVTYTGNDNVDANGWYPMKVADSTPNTAYGISIGITPNDAGKTKFDIGNNAQAALDYAAFPTDTITKDVVVITGGLPNRAPLGPDQDWFRLHTITNPADPTSTPAIGLLTATFTPDCDGSTYEFALIQPDGSSPVARSMDSCGEMQQSCIALSTDPVYAETAVGRASLGGGYTFSADVSPLHLVSLAAGAQIVNEYPWCNPLVPMVLGLVGNGMGVADAHGTIVATATNTLL